MELIHTQRKKKVVAESLILWWFGTRYNSPNPLFFEINLLNLEGKTISHSS